jgi:hypothetical protein
MDERRKEPSDLSQLVTWTCSPNFGTGLDFPRGGGLTIAETRDETRSVEQSSAAFNATGTRWLGVWIGMHVLASLIRVRSASKVTFKSHEPVCDRPATVLARRTAVARGVSMSSAVVAALAVAGAYEYDVSTMS